LSQSEEDTNAKTDTTTNKPESLTINVDKRTLDLIRERMEDKYNNFWGDVIDDEQKRTIEIADKLSPGQPFKINGKDYTFQNIGMKTWRDYTKIKSKADAETDKDLANDLLMEYYMGMLKHCFGMTEDESDRVSPGEARMIVDAAVYKVLHPIPLHPERLRNGSMSEGK
jgi:hypothetical protein